MERVGGKKKLSRLASRFVFLFANPEFYLHLASWRVVIGTPAVQFVLMSTIQFVLKKTTKKQKKTKTKI
jgi:hypothetical protein